VPETSTHFKLICDNFYSPTSGSNVQLIKQNGRILNRNLKIRKAWQSLACNPRGIAVTPLAKRITETKLNSDRPRKLSTDPRKV